MRGLWGCGRWFSGREGLRAGPPNCPFLCLGPSLSLFLSLHLHPSFPCGWQKFLGTPMAWWAHPGGPGREGHLTAVSGRLCQQEIVLG